ncbi:unnamed protein product, partial [Callosobruchus maculatus]
SSDIAIYACYLILSYAGFINYTRRCILFDDTMKLAAIFLLLLLYFQSVELLSDVIEGCKFKPGDENNSTELESFIHKLEDKTFNNRVPLDGQKCLKSECELNPAGEAVWAAREKFYKKFSIYSDNPEASTLDGCFCYSVTLEDLNGCLKLVRQKMSNYLDSTFNVDLAKIIEKNSCQSFVTNCQNIN